MSTSPLGIPVPPDDGEECSLPQDVSTAELRTQWENDAAPHPFATWVRDALEVAYDHVRSSLKKTASRRKLLCPCAPTCHTSLGVESMIP